MRLLRSALLSGSTGLHRKFQRCWAIQSSSSRKNYGLIERFNLARSFKICWVLKSYATSASSDTIAVVKARRRIPKNVRRSMVKKFVIRYRKMNAGMFPTISDAQNEVGGSYYVVRAIMQDLKHNWNTLSMETEECDALSENSVIKEISTEISDVPQSKLPGEGISSIPKADVWRSRSDIQHAITMENDASEVAGSVPCHETYEPTSILKTPDNAVNMETVNKSKVSSRKFRHKSKTEVPEKSQVPKGEDGEGQRRSSVWENLKSFASGIFSMWKGS